MTEEFKKIIDNDIVRCEEALNGNGDIRTLFAEMRSKYSPIINDFDKRLKNMYNISDYFPNIEIMKNKLSLFKAMDYKNSFKETEPQTVINNNNTNSIVIDINITFEQARETIERMTALPDSEVEEILKKINELEEIVQSNDRKTKKWENAKGIIKWIADKGVDVGIALLPLLLQIK